MHFETRLWAFTQGVRWRIALAVVVGLCAVALGVARLALLGWLIGRIFAGDTVEQLMGPIVAIGLVMVARGAFEHWRNTVAHRTAAIVQKKLRRKLFDKLAELGPAYVGRERSGGITLTLVDGVEQLETYFGQYMPQGLISLLTPVLIFAFAAFLDLPVAGVLLVFALIALFALGLPVDKRELPTSYETLAPLLIEDDEIRARCMVAPVGALQNAGADLYVTTDWPPERQRDEEPCMYLGPDSLALADIASKLATHKRVADLCAGSGVQGLVAARAGALSIEWVEAQPRAAAFCRLNGALNGVPGRVVEARVDTVDGSEFDLILANPPYVATPALAYDAFADGGLDGYDVLCDVVEYASLNLASEGLLACVFELNGPPEALFAKLEAAWTTGGARCALIHDALTERTSPAAAASSASRTRRGCTAGCSSRSCTASRRSAGTRTSAAQ